MRVTIDAAGRLVIPKPLRDELGVSGPAELEITARDGRLELTVPELEVTVEMDGGLAVLRPMGETPSPLSADDVRAAVERTRR